MRWAPRRPHGFLAGMVLVIGVAGPALASSVDPSRRYYCDGSGQPVFMIGYYGWAAVPDGYYIDHPSRYADMITRGGPLKINYVRISLGVNRFTSMTNPPVWSGSPTPVPFLYVLQNGAYKADLDQWDPNFWGVAGQNGQIGTGLHGQCELAAANGVMVHLSIFDGVEIRSQGGAGYGYANSFWNPANQVRSFYPDPDFNHNGQIDDGGEFYQTTHFDNNSGIGYYQRRLIDKVITETAADDNVFFEIGNELIGSDPTWNTHVFNYITSHSTKPVTQCGGTRIAANGYSDHIGDTAAQIKADVATFLTQSQGQYPTWIDPDGSGLSDANISADELRGAAWYSFTGGAAFWGGFTVDYWSFGRGFYVPTATYYKYLQEFISQTGVQFQQMLPRHDLVSNGSSTNSCLANVGTEYVVYVRSDPSVSLDLTGMSGSKNYRLYDPRTAAWTPQQVVSGGGLRVFNQPAGTSDWVIYVGDGCATCGNNTCQPRLGTQQTLATGITPGVATDAQGNIHVVYMNNGLIYYLKGNASAVFGPPEQIPVPQPDGPADYNSPHVVCDGNGVPHVVFEKDWYPTNPGKCWYTNRIAGSWKTPLLVFNTDLIMHPRMTLYGGTTYAFVGASSGASPGSLARISNLSGAPHLDLTAGTSLLAPVPTTDNNGHVYVVGRNSGSGHNIEQRDLNLGLQCSQKISTGTPNKTGEPTTSIYEAISSRVYAMGNCGATGIDPETSSDFWFDYSAVPCPFTIPPNSILGPAGPGWVGDQVYPEMTIDPVGRIYFAYRDSVTGEGKLCTVDVPSHQFIDQVVFTTAITDANSPIRRRWNCQIAPAPNGGVYLTWDYNNTSYIRPVDLPAAPEASIDMGSPDAVSGVTNVQNADGHTTPTTIGGRTCRQNTNAAGGDYYFYFGVSDTFAFQGSRPDLYILVDYYDLGTSSITLEYDSSATPPAFYKVGGSVALTNTSVWKTAIFHVTDAYFGNRQNAGADFRFGDVGNTFYLDSVVVTPQAPLPPVIDPIPPGQLVNPGTGYSLQLTLAQGFPPPTWTVQEPAGAQVDACGLLRWTAPTASAIQTFTVSATNAVGSDSKTWPVQVLSTSDFDKDGDVDQADFGFLQRCLSGEAVDFDQGCGPADLDDDGDVDGRDLGLFLPCMAGASQTPGC